MNSRYLCIGILITLSLCISMPDVVINTLAPPAHAMKLFSFKKSKKKKTPPTPATGVATAQATGLQPTEQYGQLPVQSGNNVYSSHGLNTGVQAQAAEYDVVVAGEMKTLNQTALQEGVATGAAQTHHQSGPYGSVTFPAQQGEALYEAANAPLSGAAVAETYGTPQFQGDRLTYGDLPPEHGRQMYGSLPPETERELIYGELPPEDIEKVEEFLQAEEANAITAAQEEAQVAHQDAMMAELQSQLNARKNQHQH